MIKKYLIRLLLKLIDLEPSPFRVGDDAVRQWLYLQKGNKGFRKYLEARKDNLKEQALRSVLKEDERQLIVGKLVELRTLERNVLQVEGPEKKDK